MASAWRFATENSWCCSGRPGCGKTTFLRIIAGLEKQTGGDVEINGEVVNELPPRTRGIAMVFQSYGLYPHFTVRNNIAFPLRTQRVAKPEIARKVAWAAQLLGIEHLLDRRPRQLSGGERQRVALARALVRDPTVFLLDEPLSNLDAKLRASARHEIRQFQQRVATTTIYVTHDQVEAMGMGDRIAVIDRGVIRQVGTPAAIYDDPADQFVATFVGTPPMNLIDWNGGCLGFRPEQFLPKAMIEDGPATEFSFRVDRVEYLGSERIVYGEIDGRHSGARGHREIATRRMSRQTASVQAIGMPSRFAMRHCAISTMTASGRTGTEKRGE